MASGGGSRTAAQRHDTYQRMTCFASGSPSTVAPTDPRLSSDQEFSAMTMMGWGGAGRRGWCCGECSCHRSSSLSDFRWKLSGFRTQPTSGAIADAQYAPTTRPTAGWTGCAHPSPASRHLESRIDNAGSTKPVLWSRASGKLSVDPGSRGPASPLLPPARR